MNIMRATLSNPIVHQFSRPFLGMATRKSDMLSRINFGNCVNFSTIAHSGTVTSKPLYPLHDAVKRGDAKLVKHILKTEITKVNGRDADGELSLIIAIKKYCDKENDQNYPAAIINDLYEYGACYLLENDKGEAASQFMREFEQVKHLTLKQNVEQLVIITQNLGHIIDGCGLSIERCTNDCKRESKKYTAEFKAKVALESLSTSLTIQELADKHHIQTWEAIKWRMQLREGGLSLFQ